MKKGKLLFEYSMGSDFYRDYLCMQSDFDEKKCPRCGGDGIFKFYREITHEDGSISQYSPYGQECECKYARAAASERDQLQRSKIPESFWDKSFEDIDEMAWSKASGKFVDFSKGYVTIKSFIYDFKKYEDEGMTLYLWSNLTGTGKTYAAAIALVEIARIYGRNVLMIDANQLPSIASSSTPGKDALRPLREVDVLLLDEVGQKRTARDYTNDIYRDIINERHLHKRPTIMTSNIEISKLNLDARVISRLQQSASVHFPEVSIRTHEAQKARKTLIEDVGLGKQAAELSTQMREKWEALSA